MTRDKEVDDTETPTKIFMGIRPIKLDSMFRVVDQENDFYTIIVWHPQGVQESFSDLSEADMKATREKLIKAGYKEQE